MNTVSKLEMTPILFTPSDIDPIEATHFCLAASLILQVNKKVLMIKRPSNMNMVKNKWIFPTHFINFSEDINTSACRIIEESVGVTNLSNTVFPIAVMESIPVPNIHDIIVAYKTVLHDEPVIRMNHNKVIDYRWVSEEELMNMDDMIFA